MTASALAAERSPPASARLTSKRSPFSSVLSPTRIFRQRDSRRSTGNPFFLAGDAAGADGDAAGEGAGLFAAGALVRAECGALTGGGASPAVDGGVPASRASRRRRASSASGFNELGLLMTMMSRARARGARRARWEVAFFRV
eukprot:CAMPEP_0119281738 /NCGR_PEP_ID=MMETSP1329-20130426/25393_1 /TAXON_ID=114041 /ORGANISM="Genus nov. species nov., Strain RCC1024" /LENGTH=142 /DNA_ID=CAMNT_0007282369 /DNA_START=19 /DNA_END=444 /DNA_ORIENTATION=-